MRKFVISLLLASVAASPAMAYAGPREDREARQQAREERKQERQKSNQSSATTNSSSESSSKSTQSAPNRQDRPQRPEREPRVERPSFHNQSNSGTAQQPQAQQPMRTHSPYSPATERSRTVEDRKQNKEMFQQRREERRATIDAAREARIERQKELRNSRPPVVSTKPAPNTQPPPPTTVRPSTVPTYNWSSSNWRHDKRYDWYNYRNKYWWLFQLSSYYDPFGWGYSPYQIGWRMWPSYYSSNYWINDPWYYRLPYAPPGTRWVRYWDDAVLVDTWSGQVVDVIYNFFW